jgi:hypothetical protein
MAKVIATRRSLDERILAALRTGLKTAGIHSKIQIQKIPRTNLSRVTILSDEFENLRPSERQDLVWRIIGQELTADEQLMISMILTLTPGELSGKDES